MPLFDAAFALQLAPAPPLQPDVEKAQSNNGPQDNQQRDAAARVDFAARGVGQGRRNERANLSYPVFPGQPPKSDRLCLGTTVPARGSRGNEGRLIRGRLFDSPVRGWPLRRFGTTEPQPGGAANRLQHPRLCPRPGQFDTEATEKAQRPQRKGSVAATTAIFLTAKCTGQRLAKDQLCVLCASSVVSV